MSPRIGWYSRSLWLETFRPGDGKGHIIIAGGTEPPEDIEFLDVVCDWCDTDADRDQDDGTEPRIFFTGSDSLCDECGRKAERQLLADMVASIRENSFIKGYEATDAEAIGILVARFFHWDGVAILRASQFALEDSNFHDQSTKIAGMADAIEKANAAKPSTSENRSQGGPNE